MLIFINYRNKLNLLIKQANNNYRKKLFYNNKGNLRNLRKTIDKLPNNINKEKL